MAVYVDDLQDYPKAAIKNQALVYGTQWCHLTADTLNELHAFAARLGLKRAWFQHHRLLPHYDLTPHMRELALANGAQYKSSREQLQALRARLLTQVE